MNPVAVLSSQPWVERLGWTLLHFLWQGVLIAAIYAAARRSRSPQLRYLLGCAALAAMVAAPIVTFTLTGSHDSPAIGAPVASVHLRLTAAAAEPLSPGSFPALSSRDNIMPWLVMAWFVGTIIFWTFVTGGWIVPLRA